MRNFSLCGLLLLLGVLVSSSSFKQSPPTIVDFDKRFVKIDDRFYVDKYEVSVGDYQIFLQEKRKEGKDCTPLLYDSTKWLMNIYYSRPYMEYYFNYPAYSNYPLVCVSYTAANEFCKWLTEHYHSNLNRKYKQVRFRLPTEQEFIKVAASKYNPARVDYPWGTSLYVKGKRQCNFYAMREEYIDLTNDTIKYRNPTDGFDSMIEAVTSYPPNSYGIFNIVGNVAEMIQEEHIAMGGGWMSTGYNVRITSKMQYEDTDVTVGFRVYMEIIEF